MPIDFPNNPTAGQTYSFNNQEWIYNGVAWDKLIIADDASALYGISGSIYAASLATGLLYGGILSINAGNSAYFDITAGKGQIHASGSTYTADPQPTLQYVTWPAQTGITLTYLATNDTTWIYIDNAGIVQQRTEYYTDAQLEENIIIGQLIHPSRSFIALARTNPNVAYATDKQYEQFIRSFGPIKVSGHTIQPNGANLKLNRTSGTAFSIGRNWINNTDNPSVVSDGAQTDCIFYRYYRGATAGTFITVPNQTAIDPTKYDNGTGTLATVPGGKYTIQRLFYYPNTPSLLGVYYGRAEYTSLADAAANINFENFTEIENTRTNAIFAGYLLVKSGATDLTNTSDALILQAGNFRSTTSGGGSVSLTLDDLTDVIITSPQNYQVLTYVDGVTGWENLSVSTLPLVSSFNGLTGAVTGVNSINGLSGAVGITNGSGIGLSVSGNTLTVSNTGVLSINGGTGAITNVAGLADTQTFTGTNTFNTLTNFPGGMSGAATRINTTETSTNTHVYPVFVTSSTSGIPRVDTVSPSVTMNPSTGQLTCKILRVSSDPTSGQAVTIGDDGEIVSTTGNYTLDTQGGGGVISVGDVSDFLNGTKLVLIDDNIAGDPFIKIQSIGDVFIGDYDSILSGNYLNVSPITGTNGLVETGMDVKFNKSMSVGLGISAAGGVTFSGTVSSDTGYRITSNAINAQIGTTYTFLSSDNGKIVTFNNGSAITVTVPAALPVGFNSTAIQLGTGQVGFTGASGVTLNSFGGNLKIAGQHGSASIIEYLTNVYNIAGTLTT